jgi:hypothetical protein
VGVLVVGSRLCGHGRQTASLVAVNVDSAEIEVQGLQFKCCLDAGEHREEDGGKKLGVCGLL